MDSHVLTHMPRLRHLLCCLAAMLPAPQHAAETARPAAEVRDAVVFNILSFVDWPPPQQVQPELRLCVVGDSTDRQMLADLADRKVRQQRVLIVHPGRDFTELQRCQAVFVPGDGAHLLPGIAAGTRGTPVLVIAENEQSLQRGATVTLSFIAGRAVLGVNTAAARAANLAISSKLLRLARTVVD